MKTTFEPQKFTGKIFHEEDIEGQPNKSESLKIQKIFKVLVIALLLGSFLTFRLIFEIQIKKNCVFDHLHQMTFGINRWLSLNGSHVFLGLGQIFMDINVAAMTLYWMLSVKNFRYVVVTAFFFYSRSVAQKTFAMPYTSYVIWQNPGFPSLSVPYDHTSDYFYSGHTGTAVFIFLQATKLKLPKWMRIYLFLTILYMMVMLVIVRVHYTIDIFGGVAFSNFYYHLVNNNLPFFDQIMNSPHRLIQKIREQVQKHLFKDQIDQIDQGTSLYDIQHR